MYRFKSNKYQPVYTPDADGLGKMVAAMLNRQKSIKLALLNSYCAERLGVSLAKLSELQAILIDDGILSIYQGPHKSTYRFTAFGDYAHG